MRRAAAGLVLLLPCWAGCGAPPVEPLAESGGISVSLEGDDGSLPPFAHPAAVTAHELEILLRKTWFTRKRTGPVRTDPAPLFTAAERATLAGLLERALAAAGDRQRVRAVVRHEGWQPDRISEMDVFVKEGTLHLAIHRMLVANTPMGDATGASNLYPRLHPREGQTLRREPGWTTPRSGPGPAPSDNWLSIPLDQAREETPEPGVGEPAGDDPEMRELAERLQLLDEALRMGVLTPEEHADKVRAVRAAYTQVSARRRALLDDLLARGLIDRDEYERKIRELEPAPPR